MERSHGKKGKVNDFMLLLYFNMILNVQVGRKAILFKSCFPFCDQQNVGRKCDYENLYQTFLTFYNFQIGPNPCSDLFNPCFLICDKIKGEYDVQYLQVSNNNNLSDH